MASSVSPKFSQAGRWSLLTWSLTPLCPQSFPMMVTTAPRPVTHSEPEQPSLPSAAGAQGHTARWVLRGRGQRRPRLEAGGSPAPFQLAPATSSRMTQPHTQTPPHHPGPRTPGPARALPEAKGHSWAPISPTTPLGRPSHHLPLQATQACSSVPALHASLWPECPLSVLL